MSDNPVQSIAEINANDLVLFMKGTLFSTMWQHCRRCSGAKPSWR